MGVGGRCVSNVRVLGMEVVGCGVGLFELMFHKMLTKVSSTLPRDVHGPITVWTHLHLCHCCLGLGARQLSQLR